MAPIPRLQAHAGPALFSYGFRPFFLLGAVYSGLAILAWLPLLHGRLTMATAFTLRDWHVHEMLFGYVAAVMTGFLLTAVPNWTGRLPIQGGPLIVLFMIWIAGRVAVTFSGLIGWLPAAAIDAAFLLGLAAVVLREIVTGRNWRNLKVAAIISILAASNVAFHLEAAPRRRRRPRHPSRHRDHHPADRADRWPHRSELYSQLAGATGRRAAAGVVRPR